MGEGDGFRDEAGELLLASSALMVVVVLLTAAEAVAGALGVAEVGIGSEEAGAAVTLAGRGWESMVPNFLARAAALSSSMLSEGGGMFCDPGF